MSDQPIESIPYASVRDPGQKAASLWPLIALIAIALGMIVLGGCFCIGLLLLVQPSLLSNGRDSGRLDDPQTLVGVILGFFAFVCLIFGFTLAFGLTRKLLKRI